MSAKELFEKLGYKQIIKKNQRGEIYFIGYEKRRTGWTHAYSYYEFWLSTKTIKTGTYNDKHDLHHELIYLKNLKYILNL